MGGYDGKGQAVLRAEDELESAYKELVASGTELVLEKFVKFACEISVIAARTPSGIVKSFPRQRTCMSTIFCTYRLCLLA